MYGCSFVHHDWTSGSRGTMVTLSMNTTVDTQNTHGGVHRINFEAVKTSENYLTIIPEQWESLKVFLGQ